MPRQSAAKPSISTSIFRLFAVYTRWYLRRHFHSVRVMGDGLPPFEINRPVIVCLNHPGWWDPLIAITLANTRFKGRQHYGPIDSRSLARYRVFQKLGFFGIEPDSVKGAISFLQTSKAIMMDPRAVLWITAEGSFRDVRSRPVCIRPGAGHLIHSLANVWVLPLAIEYTFWEERAPEALACWGEPIEVLNGGTRSPREWTNVIEGQMQNAMDRLASASQRRDKTAFEVILEGSAGIGGVYDVWRGLKARLQRQRFMPQHGSEDF